MTTPSSKGWTRKSPPRKAVPHERRHHLRPAAVVDADRDADLDFAWPDGADLPAHHDPGADRSGGAEAVHRHREVRDHGDPLLYFGRQFPDPWRGGAAHD